MAEAGALKAFECPVCLRLLHAPTTLQCGHSFCRRCVTSCLQHSLKCPQCRIDVPPEAAVPNTSVALQEALQALFPVESLARAAEERDAPALAPVSIGMSLPLFILEPLLPLQRMSLHVFEPRYIRMLERVLAATEPTFGMLCHHSAHGTLVKVLESSRLQGGRFLVTIQGTHRFKVMRTHEVDGYTMAQVVWAEDRPMSDEEASDALVLGVELSGLLSTWMEHVQQRGWERRPDQIEHLLSELGEMPSASRPAELGLWAAALVNPLPALGVAPELRVDALNCTDSLARLRIVLTGVELSLSHLQTPGLPDWLAALLSRVHRFVTSPLSSLGAAASEVASRCLQQPGALRQLALPAVILGLGCACTVVVGHQRSRGLDESQVAEVVLTGF